MHIPVNVPGGTSGDYSSANNPENPLHFLTDLQKKNKKNRAGCTARHSGHIAEAEKEIAQ
ncbi:hypothetical protein KGMB01110_07820 [Mediterraneibacter butyricigenes]|jgi:hypothetical protein|uniref:Uncharacterized protein n=1 Tax=Mediterraneibacter butyricigenes TaxID=2316025 RepID=A0A391P2U8_9FIRM|nr:hypothetical protein KGMB01110_07820 [Mediterraneibacter butyricigenes]